MADKNVSVNFGGGIISLLGVLFVGLKLGGVISWSWWWVTLPFWAGLIGVGICLVAVGILIVLVAVLGK